MVSSGSIAFIPARAGSKRLPGKNTMPFLGKPMIGWTIEAALKSECFSRVVVSTDGEDVAEVAMAYGAEVPFLRTRFADDHSTVSDVVAAELPRYEVHLGESYESVAMLMANCPLRDAAHIRSHVDAFRRADRRFQLSAVGYAWAKPWWAHRVEAGGRAAPLFPLELSARSQDLPRLLCPTGAIWLARCADFSEAGTFYGPDYAFEEIDAAGGTDIDDAEDLRLAQALVQTRAGS